MKVIITIIMLVAISLLPATDFILTNGSTIIGKLRGIKDRQMYVVTDYSELHILPFDSIQSINDGSGDVAHLWKLKRPFMDIDPLQFANVNTADGTIPVNLLQGPPPIPDPYERHFASISAALWTMNGLTIVAVVVAVLTYIHNTK